MCIGLHTLPPCLLFCGNYILHESEYDVHIFCVALDIIIYPAPRSAPARMPGMYAQRLYARTHTSGRTKSVQDAPTTNDHDCRDAEPTKHTQPFTGERGFRQGCRNKDTPSFKHGCLQVVEQSRCRTHRQQTTTVAQKQSQQSILVGIENRHF